MKAGRKVFGVKDIGIYLHRVLVGGGVFEAEKFPLLDISKKFSVKVSHFVVNFPYTSLSCISAVFKGEVMKSVGMFEPFAVFFLDDWIMEIPKESQRFDLVKFFYERDCVGFVGSETFGEVY